MIRIWIEKGLVFAIAIFIVWVTQGIWAQYVWPIPQAYALYNGWRILQPARHSEVEGYAAEQSVQQGDLLHLHISSNTKYVHADIFRMGWYGGLGGSKVASYSKIKTQKQKNPIIDTNTGLVQVSWPESFSFSISKDWKSGVYLVRLTNQDGLQSYVPFVVRSVGNAKRYLFVHTDITDEAYNAWGGSSLYRGNVKKIETSHAVQVSFHRPFLGGNGSGDFLLWEYPMIRFLEKNNFDVDYATSSYVDSHPDILTQYKHIIVTGHDEYWTKTMRDAYESAVAHGVHLDLFASNTAYRQIRVENGIITGYKDAFKKDPELDGDEENATTEWRTPEVGRPESTLTGAMFVTQVKKAYPYIITNPSNWVYAGTGAKQGQAIPGIVGYECDKVFSDFPKPATLQILSISPVVTTKDIKEVCNSSIYTALSGSIVFNAGTIQWSSALDSWHSKFGENAIIKKMTLNILQKI